MAHGLRAILWGTGTALLGSLAFLMSLLGTPLASRPLVLLPLLGMSWLILTPFMAFAFYCAFRWVAVHPAPILGALLGETRAPDRSLLIPAVAVGVAVVALIGTIPLTLALLPAMETPEAHPLANANGPQLLVLNLFITMEELVFRLALLFPLLALFGARGLDRHGVPGVRVWAPILISSALFGLAHAPDAALVGADPAQYALFALVQKGLFIGTILGFVTWRWGLEASILAHYAVNVLFMLTLFLIE